MEPSFVFKQHQNKDEFCMNKTLIALGLLGYMLVSSAGSTDLKAKEVWITTDADAKHLIVEHGAMILTSLSYG